jgi:hypothetical protein
MSEISLAPLLKAKEFTFMDAEGSPHTYILSKFPAVEGREILCQWPLTALPKVGDYEANQEIMFKLMTYVAVPQDKADPLRLRTRQLINNHAPDAVLLMSIEREMFKYNFGFFLEEKALTFFERLMLLIDSKISAMLTVSSLPSSQQSQQPSTN